MEKGYYKTFRISSGALVGQNENSTIHGGSYAIRMSNIDFVTWKKNFETGEFWVKLHASSGKEIRLKITKEELNDIIQVYGNENVIYNGDFDDVGK